MRIELYGIARLRAGTDRIEARAGTLGEAIDALRAACPALAEERLLFSLNGERFVSDPALRLSDGDILVVLNAQAGG